MAEQKFTERLTPRTRGGKSGGDGVETSGAQRPDRRVRCINLGGSVSTLY